MKKQHFMKNELHINPAIVELVKIGEGMGGTRLSGNSRGETKQNFRNAMSAAKERLKLDART